MCENCHGKGEVLARVYIAEKYGKHVISYYAMKVKKCKCQEVDKYTDYFNHHLDQQEGTDKLV